MIDINLIRENPTLVKENMKKKFQDEKVGLVDEAYKLDKDYREVVTRASEIRSLRNKYSKEIGALMREGKRDEAEEIKAKVTSMAEELKDLEVKEEEYGKELKEIMMKIPNIIHDSVPIGKDDSENVEIQKYGDPVVPEYEIPYHADIIARFNGLDKEASGRTSGNGFYYLMGDIARLSSAMLSYARDFMIDKGFTYCIPPFMIRSDVVTGVMSFDEMDAMMYKIEGEDLYLIGTSEHSMIGKFKDQILKKENMKNDKPKKKKKEKTVLTEEQIKKRKTRNSRIVACCFLLLLGVGVAGNWYWENSDISAKVSSISSGRDKVLGEATYVDATTTQPVKENAYFSSARVDRQTARDESLEKLQKIVDSTKDTDKAHIAAADKIASISDIISTENKIETLVKAKGVNNCIAVINEDATKVNVIVDTKDLTDQIVLQIKEITVSQLGCSYEDVTIIQSN